MEIAPLTLILPVGPAAHHCRWLAECLGSIVTQDVIPAEIILIDDMHSLGDHRQPGACHEALQAFGEIDVDHDPYRTVTGWLDANYGDAPEYARPPFYWTYQNPWRLGNPASVNCGVALARFDPVIIMAGDDKLLPGAVAAAYRAYQRYNGKAALYYFGIRYSEGSQEDQHLASGCAMVTKKLWQMTGGYSPVMQMGDGDAALISVMLKHFPDRLIPVEYDESPAYRQPYYWHREHIDQESATWGAGQWSWVQQQARQFVTDNYQPPDWGRYA